MRCRRILPIAMVVALCYVPDARAAALTFESVVNGPNLEVTIKIVDVTDLFTFGVDVSYDDSQFDVASVTEGSFFPDAVDQTDPSNGSFFFTVPNDVANFGSTFRIEGSLFGPTQTGASTAPGVPGILALITFGAVAGADPAIVLSGVTLLDSELNEIPTVPEPATIGLLGVGLVGLVRRFRR